MTQHDLQATGMLRGMETLAKGLVIAASATIVAFCIWALDRGFEITDESYYVLLAMHPAAVKLYISAQQWVTGLIWPITGSLALFRASGLVIVTAAACLLAHGVNRAFAAYRDGEEPAGLRTMFVISASVGGALLYAATINLSPCYNLLASAGAYAAAGWVLLALHGAGPARPFLHTTLAGAALAVEFVCKPSAGVATLFLLVLCIAFAGRVPWRRRVALVMTTAGALAMCVLALAVTRTSLADARFAIDEGLDLFRMVQTEPVGERLVRYFSEFTRLSLQSFRIFALASACVLAYLATRRAWVGALVVAAIAWTYAVRGLYLGGVDRYETVTGSAFVMLVLGLAVSFPAWRVNRGSVLVVAVLVVLPYTVAIGTGNSIFTQVIDSLAPWSVALAAVATLPFTRRNDRVLVSWMVAVFASGICLQVVTSGFRAPYHLQEPLSAQAQPVVIGSLGRVRVDAGTARFVAALDRAALECSIAPGTPFLGLYNSPGVALVLGGVPVLTPWLNNLAQAEAVLGLAALEPNAPLVVAVGLNPDGSSPGIPQRLEGFPARFIFCGEATYPFYEQRIQLWSARTR